MATADEVRGKQGQAEEGCIRSRTMHTDSRTYTDKSVRNRGRGQMWIHCTEYLNHVTTQMNTVCSAY